MKFSEEQRLVKLVREVHAVLVDHRTSRLRVKVPDGIGVTTYELRIVKTEANFKLMRPAPAAPAAARDGRKSKKGTTA